MFTFKSLIPSLLTVTFGLFAVTGSPAVAGQGSPARSLTAHFTTASELRAMQPGRFPLAPAQQDTLRDFLRTANRGQFVVCDFHAVGSIRVTQGDQTCTFVVCQVDCGGSNSAQVTVQDCTINT